MKHGDFTELAKFYVDRPGYSKVALECLKNYVFNMVGEGKVADIGAGTGKLTENLIEIGLRGYAVEPNCAMRAEAAKNPGGGMSGLKERPRTLGLRTTVFIGC